MKQLARIAALGAIGLLMMWGGWTTQRAQALVPDRLPGLQFSIDIKGLNDCTTRVRDPTCTLAAGGTFTIQVYLDALGEGITQYEGFDIVMQYAGVTPNQDASNDAWPDCGFPASYYDRPGVIGFGCAMGLPPAGPSSYTGVIGTNSFKCTQSGSVTLAYGSGNTDLYDTVPAAHTEVDNAETINIICGQVAAGTPGIVATATPGGPRNDTPPPRTVEAQTPATAGPTLEPTAAAQATATAIAARKTAEASGSPTPGGNIGGSGGGGKTWVWIVVGIAGAAAVVVAAGGGWWYMRAKGGGGGTPGTPSSGGGTSA